MRLNGHCSDFINMPWILHKDQTKASMLNFCEYLVQKTGAINKYLIDKKKTKNNKGKNAREPAIDKEWKRYYNFIKYVWNI